MKLELSFNFIPFNSLIYQIWSLFFLLLFTLFEMVFKIEYCFYNFTLIFYCYFFTLNLFLN
jgi:hypothetical protein